MSNISARLATELNAQEQQVVAATKLLDEGSTVPFIARYRKEVTGGFRLYPITFTRAALILLT